MDGQNTFIMETQGPKTPKFLPGSYLPQPGHNLRPGKRLSQVAGSGTRPSPAGTGQCLILELTGGEGVCPPNLQSSLIVGLLVTLYPQARPQDDF